MIFDRSKHLLKIFLILLMQSYRIEDFILDKPIGQGAYGQIYKATEQATGKVYALKAVNIRFLKKQKKQNIPIVEKKADYLCITDQTFREVVHYSLEKKTEEQQAKKGIEEYVKEVCEK